MADENLKEWTIMVYLAGDNNLSEDMAGALNGLLRNQNPQNISILVYYDSSVPSLPTLYYETNKNTSVPVILTKTYAKYIDQRGRSDIESSSSADSIVNFVKWSVEEKDNKAKNYALFLSGHSNGFDENTLLVDGNSKDMLSIKELKSALQQIYFVINEDKTEKKPLDILGFDSCLMGMLEIGYEFKDLAKYMIASEGETPVSGWDYEIVQSLLKRQNGEFKTAKDFAVDFVATFHAQQEKFLVGGRSVDLNALDLDETSNVVNKFSELFCLLHNLLTNPRLDTEPEFDFRELVKQQISKSLLNAHWNCQTHWFNQAIDIQDFCEVLFSDIDLMHWQFLEYNDSDLQPFIDEFEKIRLKINETISAIYKCVIAHCSLGAEFQFSNGLSAFFPWSVSAYRVMRRAYIELEFANDEDGEKWVGFLDNYLHYHTMRTRVLQNENNLFEKINRILLPDIPTRGTLENTSRGTLENTSRGTLENTSRGTLENTSRGTLENTSRGSFKSFRTFKNLNPDNYDWSKFRWWGEEQPPSFEFAKNFKEWCSNQKNRVK